jgi:type IV pilus assembly protein PilE
MIQTAKYTKGQSLTGNLHEILDNPWTMPLDGSGAQRRAFDNSGLTLIELMVTVSIVAILAGIAYPSYQQYVIRANRVEAQQFMLDIANREEEFLLNNRQYGSCCAPATTPNDLNLTVPSHLQRHYMVTVAVAASPLAFTITAAPKSGAMQAKDGTLGYTSQGVKTPPEKW